MPNLRVVAVPSELYYRERITKERARPMADKMLPEMISLLTKPVTAEERKPKPPADVTRHLTFFGNDTAAALEAFNQKFLDNLWSDGLPLVPPTPERVAWMLAGTHRKPDEVLGALAPRNGKVTIEKIAINAVMAGAKPEYLPVIIAAVEGLADPKFDELHFGTSTGSFNLIVAVSGPITDMIGMNSGIGLFSYGNRANSSIGRAVRLALINFGHTWPGVNDMALLGRPNSHTFLVFAENQALSPWEPYRLSQGFAASDSIVTLSVTGGYASGTSSNIYGGGAVALVPPETILEQVARDIAKTRGGVAADDAGAAMLAGNDQTVRSNYRKYFLIVNPEVAQELQERFGYSREGLQQKLFESASVPYEDLRERDIAAVQHAIDVGYIPEAYRDQIKRQLQPGGKVPMMSRPTDVHVVVAGGMPGYTMLMSYYRDGVYFPVAHISKKIEDATGR